MNTDNSQSDKINKNRSNDSERSNQEPKADDRTNPNSENDKEHPKIQLKKKQKSSIKKDLKNLVSIQEILGKFKSSEKSTVNKFIREKTVGLELEGATELVNKVEPISKQLKAWLIKKELLASEDEDDSDDDSDDSDSDDKEVCDAPSLSENEKLAQALKKMLHKDLKQIKPLRVNKLFMRKDMQDLKRYLVEIFRDRKKYLKLLYSKLEWAFKCYELEPENHKSECEEMLKDLAEKDMDQALRIAEDFALHRTDLEIPESLKLAAKYPPHFREKMKNEDFSVLVQDLEEKIQFAFKGSIYEDSFQDCASHADFTPEFVMFYGPRFDKMDDYAIIPLVMLFVERVKSELLKRMFDFFHRPQIIDLEIFNKVNLSKSKEEGKALFSGLPEPRPSSNHELENRSLEHPEIRSAPKNKFLDELLDYLIGHIKRSEKFKTLIELLEKVPWFKKYCGLLDARLLACLFLSVSDSAVRLRSQLNLGRSLALPLTFYDPQGWSSPDMRLMGVNRELVCAVLDSHSLLNVNVGLVARVDPKFEALLNAMFYSKFEESHSLILREGCVDVNFDHDSDSPRSVSFLTVYGQTTDLALLRRLEPLANMLMVQVSHFDLKRAQNTAVFSLIKEICEFASSNDMPVFLLVRDCPKRSLKIAEIRESIGADVENLKVILVKEENFKANANAKSRIEISKKVNDEFARIKNDPKKMNVENMKNLVLSESNCLSSMLSANVSEKVMSEPSQESLKNIITRQREEKKTFVQSLNEIADFSGLVSRSIKNNSLQEELFFSGLFLKRRNSINELRKIHHDKKKVKRIKELEVEIEKMSTQICDSKPSNLITKFHELVMSDHFALLLLLLTDRLRVLNAELQAPILSELERLKREKESTQDSNEKEQIEKSIQRQLNLSSESIISGEVLFRNLFPYLGPNRTWLAGPLCEKLNDRLIDLLLSGFALELVDGDSLEFKPDFFVGLSSRVQASTVCAIGCMGPQSSGKSTLLNHMFGTLFHTSQGRCTSGLYMSLQRAPDPTCGVKYLMIVDSEGMQSSERSDAQFDRQICSFLMNNMDMLLVNVKGEFNAKMASDLEITLYTANKLKNFTKMPEVHFIFNQANVNNSETKNTLHNQVAGMNEHIRDGINSSQIQMDPKQLYKFDLDKKYLRVLGNAFATKHHEPDSELGQSSAINFKSANPEFGREVSGLALEVFRFVEQDALKCSMRNFDRFFKLSRQSWQMIEKYTDLTTMADIKTINLHLKVSRFVQEHLQEYVQKSFDKQLKTKQNALLEIITSSAKFEGLQEKIQKELSEMEGKLRQEIEKWKSKAGQALKGNKAISSKNEICEEHIAKAVKELEMRLISFKIKAKSQINQQLFDFYQGSGDGLIKQEAHKLKADPEFASQNNNQKRQTAMDKFEKLYESFLDNFKQDSEFEDLEERKYDQIRRMASKLNNLLPIERAFRTADAVHVSSCTEHLLKAFKEEPIVRVSEAKIRNLQRDFHARMAQPMRFMSFEGCLVPSVRVEFVRFMLEGFKEDEFRRCFLEKMAGVDKDSDFELDILYNTKDELKFCGVTFVFPDKAEFKSRVRSGEDPKALIGDCVKTREVVFRKVTKMRKNARRFFKIETAVVTEDELRDMDDYAYVHKICNDARVDEAVAEAHTRSQIELFINPFDCENESKVADAMCFVAEKYLRLPELVAEIRDISYKLVYNQEHSGSTGCEDLGNVSELSKEMISRMVRQDLKGRFYELDSELDVCAAQLTDVAVGQLVYTGVLFLWKFVVESMQKKNEVKLAKLKSQKNLFRDVFLGTALDNKEENLITEINQRINREMQALNKEMIERSGQVMSKNLVEDTVKKEFTSKNIMSALRQKYFLNTNESMFQDSFEFMTNPNAMIDKAIDSLNQRYFNAEIDKLDEERFARIRSQFMKTKNILKSLKKIILENNASKGKSIMETFKLFHKTDEQSREITKSTEKIKYSIWLSQFAFDLILDILRGQTPTLRRPIEGADIYSELVFSEEDLPNLGSRLKQEAGLEEESGGNGDLCPLLGAIFEEVKSAGFNQVYDFENFFQKLETNIETRLETLKNDKLTRQTLGVESVFQDYQKSAKGCPAICKFCKKRCEDSGENDNHEHHSHDTGHQPRIFAGGYLERKNGIKIASKITCNLVDPQREVLIDGEKKKMTDLMYFSGEKRWDIKFEKSFNRYQEQLKSYQTLWDIHGKRICQKFAVSNDNLSISEFFENYKKNLIYDPSHYIIAIDESGSMLLQDSGLIIEDIEKDFDKCNFGKAFKGVNNFLEKLKTQVDQNYFYVTLILFDHECRVIHDNVLLKDLVLKKTSINQGGTDFIPVLEKSVESIKKNHNKSEQTKILIYTDGMAEYFPEKPLEKIKEMIDSGKDVQLHWFSLEKYDLNDEWNIFSKSQNFLGKDFCKIEFKVEPSETENKFMEIFKFNK